MSDYHGRCSSLEDVIKSESPDKIISLGDYQTSECINKYYQLVSKYNINSIDVFGNHDYVIYEGNNIYSKTFKQFGSTIKELIDEYRFDKTAQKNLNHLIEESGMKKEFKINDMNVLCVHGGLDGALYGFPHCPESLRPIWYRIRSINDYRKNFEKMKENYYHIMIRGHDHRRSFSYFRSDSVLSFSINEDRSYNINQGKMRIINPGDFFSGKYAILEDENLSFKSYI